MDRRRLFPAAVVVGAAALAGCVTPTKPDAPAETARAVAPPPPPTTSTGLSMAQNDVMNRLRSFIAGEGISTTQAKPGQAARLTAAWNNKVVYAPDPTHGGEPFPGLMGKMWLFGPEVGAPLTLEGEVLVGVWDTAPALNGGDPVLIETWHIDPEAARKVRRKDFFGGDGYNLFLPFTKYNVDLKRINVVARFNCVDGRSLVAAPETLTLDHSATLQRAAEKLGGLNPGADVPPPAAGVQAFPQQPIQFPLNGK